MVVFYVIILPNSFFIGTLTFEKDYLKSNN